MLPPPLPLNGSLPSSPRPAQATLGDNTGVGIGPGRYTRHMHLHSPSTANRGPYTGPIRHPRPLTAAELHLELEKEQESIVST